MNLLQFLGALEIGLIYGLVAVGVYLTFRVIDFPDLTVDGSFTLGAFITTAFILEGTGPFLSTFYGVLGGALAGLVTAYLNVRWKISGLLAGILTMTALYSINLRVLGRPNASLITEPTVFSLFQEWFASIPLSYYKHVFLLIVCLVVLVLLGLFMASKIGLAIRATGANQRVSRAYGVRVGRMVMVTLAVSNGTAALAGSLFTQASGFADISMGPGTIIIGLASVIVGETIVRTRKIWPALIGCIVGAIIYRMVIAFALNAQEFNLRASDLNMITAAIVAFTMILPQLQKKVHGVLKGKSS
jgi:putative ABC transport system permease protein